MLAAFTQVADVMAAIAEDEAELRRWTRPSRRPPTPVKDDEAALQARRRRAAAGARRPAQASTMARRARAVAEGKRLADIAQLYVATAADWREVKS